MATVRNLTSLSPRGWRILGLMLLTYAALC